MTVNWLASSFGCIGIPNFDSDRVSVVDQAGKLLSESGGRYRIRLHRRAIPPRTAVRKLFERPNYCDLGAHFGPGAVRAQVTADMDFTRIESTNEIYDPTTVLRSEQTTQDITNRGAGGGNAGELVAQPPQPGVAGSSGTERGPKFPDRESLKETRNYEVNKTISHTRRVPGTIQKLSVAVVVDYVLDENGERIALDQARIDQITALVREAIGFSAQRGDSVQVINSPFVAPAPIEPYLSQDSLEQAWSVGGWSRCLGCDCGPSAYLCSASSNGSVLN